MSDLARHAAPQLLDDPRTADLRPAHVPPAQGLGVPPLTFSVSPIT